MLFELITDGIERPPELVAHNTSVVDFLLPRCEAGGAGLVQLGQSVPKLEQKSLPLDLEWGSELFLLLFGYFILVCVNLNF